MTIEEKKAKAYDEALERARKLYEVFLDTFEVKEVDMDKTFNDEYSKFSNDVGADYAFPIDLADFKDFAKHFFALGMAVNNKSQKGK